MESGYALWPILLVWLLLATNTECFDFDRQIVINRSSSRDSIENVTILNSFRSNVSALVLSVNGVQMMDYREGVLQLSDKSQVKFEVKATDEDRTRIGLVWENAGPSDTRELCFDYAQLNWYGTFEERVQALPLQTYLGNMIESRSFTTGDFALVPFGPVIEYIFVNQAGAGVMLDPHQPLFLRRLDTKFCFSVNNSRKPYNWGEKKADNLSMEIYISSNIRTVHRAISEDHIQKPADIPDVRMMSSPIWSTWARYKRDINQQIVLEFASQIREKNFPNSQIEIDDLWEANYGDFTFDRSKFPNIKQMVNKLHHDGFRVTLWLYPFINTDSVAFNRSIEYLVRSRKQPDKPYLVTWWDGLGGVVDFSNPKAADWFVARVETIRAQTGIDSFKFDAGELSWYGEEGFQFSDPQIQKEPNQITQKYVETCARLGSMIEVRSAYRSQHLPVFLRMLDKDSNWSDNNGLKSLIPTALTLSLAGYVFILPDMIGGNAYGVEVPNSELYIRWLQANVFMSSMQFSIVPWQYNNQTIRISRSMVKLHQRYSPLMVELARNATETGEPILRPLWYEYPEDEETYGISDQFLLGSTILVAPVLEPNQVKREVYFPEGVWTDQHGANYTGPRKVTVSAPLEELPYFTK